jgi:signal transduction histidine kinase
VIHMMLLAGGVTLAAGLVGAAIIVASRGRTALTMILSTVFVAVAATSAGVAVAANRMFISRHDSDVLAAVLTTSTVVAVVCAAVVGRRVSQLIEDHSRAEASLHAEHELEHNRRELVSWMSHDLRSPLAGIRAMAEALEDGVVDGDEAIASYHRGIREESERLTSMVDGLFELSRIHGGSLVLNKERVALSDIVAQSLPTMAALAANKHVQLDDEIADVAVDVDVRDLTRVLSNLLANAIRHTPTGGHISIRGSLVAAEANLSVDDQCGGIAGVHLPHVFDVSFRGTAARTPSVDGGAGLGLAIARGIVDAHGGRIAVANTARGCRFTISLPVASSLETTMPPTRHARPPVPVRSLDPRR